jgi:hypothetical protein
MLIRKLHFSKRNQSGTLASAGDAKINVYFLLTYRRKRLLCLLDLSWPESHLLDGLSVSRLLPPDKAFLDVERSLHPLRFQTATPLMPSSTQEAKARLRSAATNDIAHGSFLHFS